MDRIEIVFLVLLFIITAIVLTFAAICLGEEFPPAPELPTNSWVYGTVGTGDIESIDEVETGDIICQEKTPTGDWKLLPGGILMSENKAHYFGKVKIAYTELRLLYQVDLSKWSATMDIYTNELSSAQRLTEKLTKEKKRSWWEQNDFQIGIALGVVITIGVMVGAGVMMSYVGNK